MHAKAYGTVLFQRPKQIQDLTWLWASAKRYMDSNRLTGYEETDIWKIYRMERFLVTHVRKIYIIKRTMERLSPTSEKQIEK